ncbi:glyoxalase [Bacillus sp. Soil768D1]|nr:glyoxalase [Bacillus sp. Soil768D1]
MKFQSYPNTYVGYVHIIIEDLSRSLKFYKEIIGFEVLEQSADKAVLTADGKTPLLILEQPDGVTPKQLRTTGLYHFALLVPCRADLAKILLHLIQCRYPLQGASDHYVSEAIYLGDPDGNGIEIYCDRPEETWKWQNGQVEMGTEALDAEGLLAENDESPWTGLPSETVMGHIHLHVADIGATEEFYTKGLGFDIVVRYGGQALFVSTGNYHHHIGLNTWNGVGAPAPEATSVGLKSFTLILPSEEARKNTVERLQQLGSFINQEKEAVVTKDPSGNVIHLVVPTLRNN